MITETSVMEVTAVLEELRSQMAALAERIAKLEASSAAPPAPAEVPPSPPQPVAETEVAAPPAAAPQPERAPEPVVEEAISEEILIVISAAVAAYLGERAHIRQVRLIRTGAWAQEGRVSIQASHRLH